MTSRDSPRDRAADLLSRMTLEEKCHQLTGAMAWDLVRPDGSPRPEFAARLQHAPGHISQLIRETPAQLADMIAGMQKRFVEQTRLGIPAFFHAEALSGILAGGRTAFPTPIALAATWRPDLVERMADVMRRQMVAMGVRHALSPVMDVALDPRWGRVHETYGEDPYLVAEFSTAFTRGLQGEVPTESVIATGKHFLAYASSEAGLNASGVDIGPRRLRDVFAFPFAAAIRLAGLGSVMNSYADIDGVPVGASREILTVLLRDELGFDGFVSADYASIDQLLTRQGVARDLGEAGRLALTAGLDVELPKESAYGDLLVEEVRAGRLDVAVVDTSVLRVLEAKFRVGLFEDPYPAASIETAAADAEGDALSEELARRSVVLLENDGLLPLRVDGIRLAVVGPHADAPDLQFAAYSYVSWRGAVDAIHLGGDEGTMVGVDNAADDWHRALVEPGHAAALPVEAYGTAGLATALASAGARVTTAAGSGITRRLGDAALDEARRAVADADVAVVALGGASLWFTGERTEGEASDTADIALPAAQRELLDAVAESGRPFIVVLVQGRAYALPESVHKASAVLVASYGGPFGATAIAEAITGDIEPLGRLPYSIPRHSGQVPVYHHRRTGSGGTSAQDGATASRYLDLPADAAYPFGAGQGYGRFELGAIDAPTEIGTSGAFAVRVPVRNTGERAAETLVQLYLRSRVSGTVRPFQQLAGYTHVHLEAGADSIVEFALDSAQLAATASDLSLVVEPGTLQVVAGLHAFDDRATAAIEVTGPRRVVAQHERVFFSRASVSTSGDERR